MKPSRTPARLPVGDASRLKGAAPSNGRVMAPNPAQMIEHHRKSVWRHLRLIPLTVLFLVLLEVFAPSQWKPTNLAGEAVTRYRTHLAINDISTRLTLEDEAPYAGVLAQAKPRRLRDRSDQRAFTSIGPTMRLPRAHISSDPSSPIATARWALPSEVERHLYRPGDLWLGTWPVPKPKLEAELHALEAERAGLLGRDDLDEDQRNQIIEDISARIAEINPAVPVTVSEQVESTHEAFEAGASIVHAHVRNDDQTPSSDPEKFARLKEGLEQHCPGMILQFSTGGRSGAGQTRGGMLPLAPDMASLSVGSNNFPTRVYENPPDLVDWLASEMKQHAVKPEIEAFDLSHVFQAAKMHEDGRIEATPYVQFVMGVKNAMPVDRRVFDFYVETVRRPCRTSPTPCALNSS